MFNAMHNETAINLQICTKITVYTDGAGRIEFCSKLDQRGILIVLMKQIWKKQNIAQSYFNKNNSCKSNNCAMQNYSNIKTLQLLMFSAYCLQCIDCIQYHSQKKTSKFPKLALASVKIKH